MPSPMPNGWLATMPTACPVTALAVLIGGPHPHVDQVEHAANTRDPSAPPAAARIIKRRIAVAARQPSIE
jgi:hypothetical protein